MYECNVITIEIVNLNRSLLYFNPVIILYYLAYC